MTAPAESHELVLPRRRSRVRAAAAFVVLAVAGLLLLLTTFAVWVDRVALNTNVFVDTSSELIEDDEIRRAVAERSADELFTNVDVQAILERRIPDQNLDFLATLGSAGARQAAPELLDRALRQPALQRLWARTVRRAHAELVAVLEGGSTRVSTEEGIVTLDLRDLVLETAERFGIRRQVERELPADAGRIEVLSSSELDTAQDGFHVLKTLAWFLPVLTVIAFGGAVALAVDRRRAIRGVGVTIAIVGILGLVAASLVENYIVGELVQERDARAAAHNAWDILTELMRSTLRWLVVLGILFVVAAWLAGPGRRAVAARRLLAPALASRLWAYGGLGVATLILLLTGPVADFSRFLAIAVLVALGVVWIEVTRRQALREFPDARGAGLLDEARTRLEEWWETRPRPAESRPAPRQSDGAFGNDLPAKLEALAGLHARGALTDAEYAAAKSRVLAGE
jgi:Short C-terminal domain